MGEVFLARDLSFGRLAAIKLVPPGVDPRYRARLLREAQSAVRLQHPAIATLYESGEADGEAYIAMEYVRGETLRGRLEQGALPIPKALGIAGDLLEALGHAHAVGILHRDIKPENVMVLENGGAKLLDFGLAKPVQLAGRSADFHAVPAPSPPSRPDAITEVGEDGPDTGATLAPVLEATITTLGIGGTVVTEEGHVVGTPGYMSPEQVRGRPLGPPSDLFSVGALLYETIAGQKAFPGATRVDRMKAVLVPGPHPLEPDRASPELNAVLARALARDPDDRFQSSPQFLAELRKLKEWRGSSGLANTLAVLEFTNASGNAADNWIGGALAVGLTKRLAGGTGIQVVPQPKVLAVSGALHAAEQEPTPLDMGLRLSCRWVLSGTYQKTQTSLRVITHLTDIPVAEVSATQQFEGPADAVLDAQVAIFEGLVTALRTNDTAREIPSVGTDDPRAYELYVRGRQITMRLDKSVLEQAIAFLQEAVEIDPQFADAHAALGRVRALRSAFAAGQKDLEAAAESARHALRLDPNSADGHYTLGYAAFRSDRFEEGLPHMRRAMDLAPTDPIPPYMVGGIEGRLGQREAAIELLQTAVRLNPTFGMAWVNLGWVHLELGHREEAVWCLSQAVAVEGLGTAPAAGCAGYLGECLRRMGRLEEARAACLSGLAATERTNHIYRDTFRGVCLCSLGRVALDQADRVAASTAFEQAITHLRGRPAAAGGGYLLVQALAGLARAAQSIAPFEEALDLFEGRRDYKFTWVWGGCSDDLTLLELALAARDMGLSDEFARLLQKARDAHLAEALLEEVG
jgi:tetratricopeptide (TPR) repeat protein